MQNITFHSCLQRIKAEDSLKGTDTNLSQCALSVEDEKSIVTVLRDYTKQGNSLPRDYVADSDKLTVQDFLVERLQALPFKKDLPVKLCIKLFLELRKEKLKLRLPYWEEKIRWRSCNAESLVTHFPSSKILLQTIA